MRTSAKGWKEHLSHIDIADQSGVRQLTSMLDKMGNW
jgi:hypothetical protein